MGPAWLVGGEKSEPVNAEGSTLATFFPLAIFLALGAEGHLLAMWVLSPQY